MTNTKTSNPLQLKLQSKTEANPFYALAQLKPLLPQKNQQIKTVNKEDEILQKTSKQLKEKSPTPSVNLKPNQIQEEANLFQQNMADVTPLQNRFKQHPAVPPAINSWNVPNSPNDDLLALNDLFELVNGKGDFDLSYTDEYVEGHIKGLSPTIMEKLKLGRFPIQDHLDLHGMSLNQAQESVCSFILNSVSLGKTSLLIIHGRGHRSENGFPILKHNLENIPLYKQIKKYILAFTTARPIDGGPGSSYVLLRS